jgi:hypothetical protein
VHVGGICDVITRAECTTKPMNWRLEHNFVVRRTISSCSATSRDGTRGILSQRSCPIHGRVSLRYLIGLRT